VEPFDFIYGDAFNDFAVPSPPHDPGVPREAEGDPAAEDGALPGQHHRHLRSGLFLGAIWNTMREVFRTCTSTRRPRGRVNEKESGRDTYIVIGALQPLDLENSG
jgi:hypothetical protein